MTEHTEVAGHLAASHLDSPSHCGESVTPMVGAATSHPAPIDPRIVARAALRHRHSQNLARLMGERSDLRGVHALADFVDESLRWTA